MSYGMVDIGRILFRYRVLRPILFTLLVSSGLIFVILSHPVTVVRQIGNSTAHFVNEKSFTQTITSTVSKPANPVPLSPGGEAPTSKAGTKRITTVSGSSRTHPQKPSTKAQPKHAQGRGTTGIVHPTKPAQTRQPDPINCVIERGLKPHWICVHSRHQDRWISGSILDGGTWEAHITAKALEFLSKCNGCGFLDIGANIGVHSLAIAVEGYRVLAVEPSPHHLLLLRESVRKNNFQNRMQVLPVAISDHEQDLAMTVAESYNMGHTVVKRILAANNVTSTNTVFTVHALTLDALVGELTFKRAVMKIDVESFECVAFRTSQRLLSEIDIPVIFIEFFMENRAYNASCINEMVELLWVHDYKQAYKRVLSGWIPFEPHKWEAALPLAANDVMLLKAVSLPPSALNVSHNSASKNAMYSSISHR